MKPLFTALCLILSTIACGGAARGVAGTPDWFTNGAQDTRYEIGKGTAESRNYQLALNMARTQARTAIAENMRTEIRSVINDMSSQVGLPRDGEVITSFEQATVQRVEAVLTNTEVVKQEVIQDGRLFRAYVQLRVPRETTSEAFLSAMQSDQTMYTRLRASEAFKRLEDEFRKKRP